MITTARWCRGRLAPLLALLTTTAATPVDYAADQGLHKPPAIDGCAARAHVAL